MIIKKVFFTFIITFISFSSPCQQVDNSTKFYINKIESSITYKRTDSILYYYKKIKPLGGKKNNYTKYLEITAKVGNYYDSLGDFEKSIDVYQNALAIAEHFNDKNYLSKILVDLSHTYRIFHDYKKAILYGKKAFNVLPKDSLSKIFLLKAYALNVTAAAFTENKQPDSALVYQEKVLSYLPLLDSTDVKNTFVNIGYTHMELNQLKKAKIYTDVGLKLYKPTKSNYALGAIYTNLAMYGRRAKKYEYALKMFDTAISYTRKDRFIETYFWIYDERAQVYKSLNQYEKASEDLEKLLKIKDSIFQNERAKTALETEVKYETSKKEKEIALQKEALLQQELEIKSKTLYTTLLIFALSVLGIVFIAIYKRNQLKRKQLQKEIDLKDALATIKTQNRLQEQRLRISRDLHDNIGSQLTFIISSIDNLKYLSKDTNAKLKNKLSNISSFTSVTIHELRDTIWAMNKSEISMEDLHSRILSFVEKAKVATNKVHFEVNYNIDKNVKFSSLIGINLFRVIQEAINNAIKYAEATNININLEKNGNDIAFSIKDNGVGFDINTVTLGNGLSNMEKRMSEIEGKLYIKSNKNNGTQITLSLAEKNTANDV